MNILLEKNLLDEAPKIIMNRLRLFIIILILLIYCSPLLSEPFYVYMSPLGNDMNSGVKDKPVKSLNKVHEILMNTNPNENVIIKIDSKNGSYVNQNVVWTYYNPDYLTIFESNPKDKLARFISNDNPPDKPFFVLKSHNGESTNIIIRNLYIKNYVTPAIIFIGDRESYYGWNGYNIIEKCTFENIGNWRMPERPIFYSALALVNSRSNLIRECKFINISNHAMATFPQDRPVLASKNRLKKVIFDFLKKTYYKNISDFEKRVDMAKNRSNLPIVCIYIAYHSDSNIVDNCNFYDVMGDAVRIRDDSNYNTIKNNYFELVGWNSVISSYYCDTNFEKCSKNEVEKQSKGIKIISNIFCGNWLYGKPEVFSILKPNKLPFYDANFDSTIVVLNNNKLKPYKRFFGLF